MVVVGLEVDNQSININTELLAPITPPTTYHAFPQEQKLHKCLRVMHASPPPIPSLHHPHIVQPSLDSSPA